MDWHNYRFNATVKKHFNQTKTTDISKLIDIPSICSHGTYKARMVYDQSQCFTKFSKYDKKLIQNLKCVYDDDIDYQYKYLDRKCINTLLKQNSAYDDILIVKNGHLTDSSYCNIALLSEQQWYTPSSPLLNGTQRQFLLEKLMIKPREISISELKEYSHIALFNAMIPFEEKIVLSIDKIEL